MRIINSKVFWRSSQQWGRRLILCWFCALIKKQTKTICLISLWLWLREYYMSAKVNRVLFITDTNPYRRLIWSKQCLWDSQMYGRVCSKAISKVSINTSLNSFTPNTSKRDSTLYSSKRTNKEGALNLPNT